jgi:hypothetical protein
VHEKDIELAKLLLGKLNDLVSRQAQLSADLSQAQDELETQWQMREERGKYLDILSRAADLLNRTDLREELPETTQLEQQVTQLESALEAVTQEVAQHRELVDGLSERAPGLIALARGEDAPGVGAEIEAADGAGDSGDAPEAHDAADEPAAPAMPEDETGADATTSAELADVPEEVGPDTPPSAGADHEAEGEAGESLAGEPDAMPAPAPVDEPEAQAAGEEQAQAADEAGEADAPVTHTDHGIDPEISLGRFNLANLKRREAFTHGRGAAYIIDAASVLERVPNYDHYVRGIELEQTREELIRDFDILGRELSGTFHLVFSQWFQYTTQHGNNLTVEFSTGPNEGTKEASDRRLRELVFEMTAKLRPVCVITGDRELLESVRGQGIHPILLGEFFRA